MRDNYSEPTQRFRSPIWTRAVEHCEVLIEVLIMDFLRFFCSVYTNVHI